MGAKSKKYDRTVTASGGGFVARVVRRRTTRGTTIEREATGFKDRPGAEAWGEKALAEYLTDRQAHRERRKAARARRRDAAKSRDEWLSQQTCQSLAQCVEQGNKYASLAKEELKYKAETLWQEVSFGVLKNGGSEQVAISVASEKVGKNGTQRFRKALAGEWDWVSDEVRAMALNNAMDLRAAGITTLLIEQLQEFKPNETQRLG